MQRRVQDNRKKQEARIGTADRQSGLERQTDAQIQRLHETVGQKRSALLPNGPRQIDGVGTAGEDIQTEVSELLVRYYEQGKASFRS